MEVQSVQDLIDRGLELSHGEAIAIAQQLVTSVEAQVEPAPPLGPPSLDNVRLGPDGSVICSECTIRPAVAEVATLLRAMLPRHGTTRVPGALRYAIARALGEVDAPPFDSLADLSRVLARHEQGDRFQVLRELHARAAVMAPRVAVTNRDRRDHGPAVAELRRHLREADEALFHLVNGASVKDREDIRSPVRPGRALGSRTAAGFLVIGGALIGSLIMLGVMTVGRSASFAATSAAPDVHHELPDIDHHQLPDIDVPRGGLASLNQATIAGRAPMPADARSVRLADQEIQIARKEIALGLPDRALINLQALVARHPSAAAYFLIASVQETRGDHDQAVATYLEIAHRFPHDARAPEAMFSMVRCLLRSKLRSKTIEARTLLGELATKYPGSSWAPRALIARGELEERDRLHQRDKILDASVPTQLVTYRQVALKDHARARGTYRRVPPMSPHFGEARKRLQKEAS
jgi:tetratricopeptide (TPR) repeat protein